MKMLCALFHHNGFIIQAEGHEDFRVILGRQIGWGKFCRVTEPEAMDSTVSRFELREFRPASGPVPYPVFSDANVLWHLEEARTVLNSLKR